MLSRFIKKNKNKMFELFLKLYGFDDVVLSMYKNTILEKLQDVYFVFTP